MARIEINGDTLTVHIEGVDKVLALRSRLDVPLEHVISAAADPELAKKVPRMLRLPGTYIPGVVTAGSYLKPGSGPDAGWSFWDVHDLKKAVVIQLASEHYKWIVVGVDDPAATAEAIQEAITLK